MIFLAHTQQNRTARRVHTTPIARIYSKTMRQHLSMTDRPLDAAGVRKAATITTATPNLDPAGTLPVTSPSPASLDNAP